MWKGKYQSTDNTKNRKIKRKLLMKKWKGLQTKGTHEHMEALMITDVFLNQKRVNVCEHRKTVQYDSIF